MTIELETLNEDVNLSGVRWTIQQAPLMSWGIITFFASLLMFFLMIPINHIFPIGLWGVWGFFALFLSSLFFMAANRFVRMNASFDLRGQRLRVHGWRSSLARPGSLELPLGDIRASYAPMGHVLNMRTFHLTLSRANGEMSDRDEVLFDMRDVISTEEEMKRLVEGLNRAAMHAQQRVGDGTEEIPETLASMRQTEGPAS
ncbi:MAG: hypothetical protein AAFV53_38240 [Myxococcota bacterium]